MEKEYQFVKVPTNLFILLDNNCRSMLFTLIQLSSFYADEDGWFFRTYEDLESESNLSQNLVKATIQTLFNHHLIEARPTGYGKGKKPNYYKVNFENFGNYENITIEGCIKNPDLKIRTVPYKGSNFKLNLVRETVNDTVTNVVTNSVKSDNNEDNIENVDNKKNEKNETNKTEEDFEVLRNDVVEETHSRTEGLKYYQVDTVKIELYRWIRQKYNKNAHRLENIANTELEKIKKELMASMSMT